MTKSNAERYTSRKKFQNKKELKSDLRAKFFMRKQLRKPINYTLLKKMIRQVVYEKNISDDVLVIKIYFIRIE